MAKMRYYTGRCIGGPRDGQMFTYSDEICRMNNPKHQNLIPSDLYPVSSIYQEFEIEMLIYRHQCLNGADVWILTDANGNLPHLDEVVKALVDGYRQPSKPEPETDMEEY